MPGVDKLLLEEALEDAPQTRSLLGVFEQDVDILNLYTSELLTACRRLVNTQHNLGSATQELSKQLLQYEKLRFPLAGEDTIINSTIQQFAKTVDEISSWHAVLATQLVDGLMFPLNKFMENDVTEAITLRESFRQASEEHDAAILKYSRLSKKRDSEKAKLERQEANDELHMARRKFHQLAMQYYAAQNSLQYKRRCAMLEPFVGYIQAQVSFFRMGQDIMNQQLEDFLKNISTSVGNVKAELSEEAQRQELLINTILAEAQVSNIYSPEPLTTQEQPDKEGKEKSEGEEVEKAQQAVEVVRAANKTLTQKAGYLNIRSRHGLMHQWDRMYFFTQGGNLMSQARNQFAGSLVMDLDNTIVEPTDVDDRRFVFQIKSPEKKGPKYVLQADSEAEQEEWVSTLHNISQGLYLKDNPQEAMKQMLGVDKSIEVAEEQAFTGMGDLAESRAQEEEAKVEAAAAAAAAASAAAASAAAASAAATSAAAVKTEAPAVKTKETKEKKGFGINLMGRSRKTSGSSSSSSGGGGGGGGSGGGGKDPSSGPTPSPLDMIAATPIQFEIIPMGEEHQDDRPKDGPPRHVTPFVRFASVPSGPAFTRTFAARFLGSMEVGADRGSELIFAAMRQIMAARAIHSIFRTQELQIIINNDSLRLVEQANNVVMMEFGLENISMCAAHKENTRLFGFIARGSKVEGERSKYTCHVFEANSPGTEICQAVADATQNVLKQKQEEDSAEKQKEIENSILENMMATSATPPSSPSSSSSQLTNGTGTTSTSSLIKLDWDHHESEA
ncbi:DCC-interacting protein 13-alpha-like isoform X2 [Branchiostoma floridae x Branchiostoma japonicum]